MEFNLTDEFFERTEFRRDLKATLAKFIQNKSTSA